MPRKAKDLTGMTFNRLTVLSRAENSLHGMLQWNCRCSCGTEKFIRATELKNGNIKSCGCWRSDMMKERQTTHGRSSTLEFKTWHGMINRCYHPDGMKSKYYAERGIVVCDRWRNSFENFLADMGERPSPSHSIDRIDVNGNYEPSNCRWATQIEQCRNRRNTTMLEYRGERISIHAAAQISGLKVKMIRSRIKRGWSPELAINTPPLPNKWAMRAKAAKIAEAA